MIRESNGETDNSWKHCLQRSDRLDPFFVTILGLRYGSDLQALFECNLSVILKTAVGELARGSMFLV